MRNVLRIAAPALLAALAACQDEPVGPAGPTPAPAKQVRTEGFPTPGELRSGYIRGRDGKPLRITYEVRDGLAVWQGDIVLGPAGSVASSPGAVPGPRRGVSIEGFNSGGQLYRWPGGVVPYVIDPSLPNPARVLQAIAQIEASTVGIRFVPRGGEADYVRVIPSDGCASYVGRIGGAQTVWLADGCGTGSTVHELSHALGMWHEQSRCDRDQFVEILWGNIDPERQHNFYNYCDGASDVSTYAEGSIMHYGPYSFSINGQPTIRSRRGLDAQMGQRSGLGSTDVFTLRAMYPPSTAIHRLYNPNWAGGDHLYGTDPREGGSLGFVLEQRHYFYLTSAAGASYAALYRCAVGGHHFLSRDPFCESGVQAEAALGQLAASPLSGTVPLYRVRHAPTGHRLSTTHAGERQGLIDGGWVDEGVTGYVWTRIPIHRLYNPGWGGGDHMYSHDPAEGRGGFVLETQAFFFLTSLTGPDYAPLYRCFVYNHHFLSRDRSCETGTPAEGEMGLVAVWQMPGTVPLYRLFNPRNSDHLFTTHAGERQGALAGGWVDEGVAGYVWEQP
ncbi:MAG TPA: M12 family metallopeptidase [Longimicrobium sp.]